ncbi:MAG TPA: rhodanese-like domain-containing protein [Phycisphaerae bacterium]|nr:rhodanese-like domain-containing protein [Phycisphaerae bacterium]
MKKCLQGCVVTLIAFGLVATVACESTPNPSPSPSPTPTPGPTQFETVRVALDTYFSSSPPGTIAASDVFDLLNDGDDSNDPYILSVRAPEHYAIGHIPGAVNIPWRSLGQEGALADLPTDRQIVVYCYTGHTGALSTTFLNALGYDAVNLKFGIMSWTTDPDVRATVPFSEATDAHDYPLETTANVPTETYSPPTLNVTTSTDETEIVRAAGDAYLSSTAPPTISAVDVFDLLNDGDDSNDPVIISVRSATHYALGHVPGAINIPWQEIAKTDNLAMIPTDKPIVVYCYTGHTGGLATMALRMLGYEATNMKHGICAWTTDSAVRVVAPFDEATQAHDYPLESETTPGVDGAALFSTNCSACHGADGGSGFAPNVQGYTAAEVTTGLGSATHASITLTTEEIDAIALFLESAGD